MKQSVVIFIEIKSRSGLVEGRLKIRVSIEVRVHPALDQQVWAVLRPGRRSIRVPGHFLQREREREREFVIDNLLVRVHYIIVVIK